MIDLYNWPTPNGRKIFIMLEECGLAYRVFPVDIGQGEQFLPEFLTMNPNAKIPTLVDHDGPSHQPICLFESGAILTYLAEKTGKFMPTMFSSERCEVMQWLTFQVSTVGPMFGQFNHFHRYCRQKIPYAMQRYQKEAIRICSVLDQHLQDRTFLAGDYSIADMATFPWIRKHLQYHKENRFLHLARWVVTIESRQPVQKALSVMSEHIYDMSQDQTALKKLFNQPVSDDFKLKRQTTRDTL